MTDDIDERLSRSIYGLRDVNPMLSAERTFVPRQRNGILIALVVLAVLTVLWPYIVLPALIGLATLAYLSTIVFRVSLMFHAARHPGTAVVTDEEARAFPDDKLPTYTVMIPCYKEPEVVAQLLHGMVTMEYPRDKMDVKLLLEADDGATIDAAREANTEQIAEIIVVPPAEPRTKPKALNYGLQSARGEYVTIFDAEDRPDPLQLRKAAIALSRAPDDIACLQAELAYFNPDQNIITRWFTLEYELWFRQFLPGLSRVSAPIPLGGTSNHFRKDVLIGAGGWDPFNVTEDADLGVRLHRLGYRTGMLSSVTLEEANSDFVNWVKQRSRWYKGYLQTWLVHMREPRKLVREVGWRGFLRFNLFVGGTPMLAMLNPLFWGLTLSWFLLAPPFVLKLFWPPVYYTGLATWLFGNFFFAYTFLYAAYQHPQKKVFTAALLAPVYWVAMSMAATKAFVQLIFSPQYWEKTQHGLTTKPAVPQEQPTSPAQVS
jgi:glycosyltransferase XagB